ncbi:MAG TPA: carboxypeptidase-like regulatory domain-containing protein, partial [Kribbellaceae bacterium]|nr:carboxypeptidase-like regulatory domain-containing protein [Kribbellaceae bacterium]
MSTRLSKPSPIARATVVTAVAAALTGGAGLLHAAPAAAANPTVQGTVVDSGGTPQPDVVVEVLTAGSTNVVTTTMTSAPQGTFSVTIPSGLYDFRFTPPETSGLRVYLATGVNADSNAPLTVVLQPVAVVHVNGVLQNSQGTAYVNGSITFQPTSGPTTERSIDSTGRYTVDLLAGQYN